MQKQFKYYIIHKPYNVLSQFTDKQKRKTLADVFNFPKNVYPVGRLDMDSEGLLLITDDKVLTDFILNPKNRHEKEYYVQVEGIPDAEAIKKIEEGVIIQGRKTLPAKVKEIEDPKFPARIPPIRERKNIPVSWLSISIVEGKHRQVRKMTAAVGCPTLRLIRVRLKKLKLGKLNSGEVRELSPEEVKDLKR